MAFHRLFDIIGPDINVLQTTMASGSRSWVVFSSMLLGWDMCLVDAIGLFSGLFFAWNLRFIKVVPYLTSTGILLNGKLRYLIGPSSGKLIWPHENQIVF